VFRRGKVVAEDVRGRVSIYHLVRDGDVLEVVDAIIVD
jgi:hypothetical protein